MVRPGPEPRVSAAWENPERQPGARALTIQVDAGA